MSFEGSVEPSMECLPGDGAGKVSSVWPSAYVICFSVQCDGPLGSVP